MVLFAGKTVWSMSERFECTTLAKKALYKYSSFPFLSFPFQDTSPVVDPGSSLVLDEP